MQKKSCRRSKVMVLFVNCLRRPLGGTFRTDTNVAGVKEWNWGREMNAAAPAMPPRKRVPKWMESFRRFVPQSKNTFSSIWGNGRFFKSADSYLNNCVLFLSVFFFLHILSQFLCCRVWAPNKILIKMGDCGMADDVIGEIPLMAADGDVVIGGY